MTVTVAGRHEPHLNGLVLLELGRRVGELVDVGLVVVVGRHGQIRSTCVNKTVRANGETIPSMSKAVTPMLSAAKLGRVWNRENSFAA